MTRGVARKKKIARENKDDKAKESGCSRQNAEKRGGPRNFVRKNRVQSSIGNTRKYGNLSKSVTFIEINTKQPKEIRKRSHQSSTTRNWVEESFRQCTR